MAKRGRRDTRKNVIGPRDHRLPQRADEGERIQRILDSPDLARVVPQLQPEVLHQIIERRGLEACSDLVALATPDQLRQLFDLDLWRPARPGFDEQLDTDRFAAWLEVLMESGPSIAAAKIAGIDAHLVIAALAQHLQVFDPAAIAPFARAEGDEPIDRRERLDTFQCDVGGYIVEATRTDAWDAIVDLLMHLDAEHPHYFHRLMSGCRSLSNSRPELDGLHDHLDAADQRAYDLAVDREQRRQPQGYVSPAEARAFLESARRMAREEATVPPPNPIARSYFQAIAGGVSKPGDLIASREAASVMRTREFGYLANTLASGCSVQSRRFTAQEASDAVNATCKLGLEHWPSGWPATDDLVSLFQVGWTVLHDEVCMPTSERLLGILADMRHSDPDIQSALSALRVDLLGHWRAGTPWRAQEALDVIAFLDMPAWAALLGLIAECPVIHAGLAASQGSGVRTVSASAFEFISSNAQLEKVRLFIERLPKTLSFE